MTNDKHEPTRDQFADRIKNHELTILRNDGIYRHLRCAKPNTGCSSFEIITWPGYLAYCGDMGDYVFSRTKDMFRFFRRESPKLKEYINPGYWEEKVQAEDKCAGIKEFSVEAFRDYVLSDAREHLGIEENAELPADIADDLWSLLNAEDEWECIDKLRDFSSDKLSFEDWEHDCKVYTYRYLFCCRAIVWAISKYDEVTNA